jgi:3-hydroxyacyl-CoA dehydrogenase
MGAGIAQAAAVAGYGVRVRDVKPEQVARGLKTARDLTVNAARKGRFSRQESAVINSRLSGTTDLSGFKHADLVIEAVFEDVGVKRQVISDLEGVLAPEAVIASNTSAAWPPEPGTRSASWACTSSPRCTRCRSWRSSVPTERRTEP